MGTTNQAQIPTIQQGTPPATLSGVKPYLAQQQVNLNQFASRLTQQITLLEQQLATVQAAAQGVIIGVPNGTRWIVAADDTDRANPIINLQPAP